MVSADIWRIGDIFRLRNDRKFLVPFYQRGYAWEESHILDFCEDLLKIDSKPGKKHPFGTIYTETVRNGSEKIKIIDGQQRATTATIFLCVVRDWIDEFSTGHKIADELNDILYLYDRVSLAPDLNSPTLTLSRLNNNYYKKCILKRKIYSNKISDLDRTDNDSCENIKTAYKTIREFLASMFIEEGMENKPSEQVLKLNRLTSTLLANFELIHIDVPTELEAYHMFHTINHRGLKLAESDLIKHLLFSKLEQELSQSSTIIKEEKLNECDENWTDLRNKITQEDSADYELSNFIHHHLVVFINKDTKKDDIYEGVEEWAKLNSAIDIIDVLLDWAGNFYNLRKPEGFFSGEPEIMYYLKRIKDLNYLSIYPLIIAGYEKFWKKQDKTSFKKLVEISFKYHIRNKLIARINVTPFEAILKETARLLFEGITENGITRDATLGDIVNKLISEVNVHRPKDILEGNLNILSVPNTKLSSVLLQEIERIYDSDKKPGDDVSVEHIMPSSKSKWANYIKEKHNFTSDDELTEFHSKYRNYLGNQVLLPLPKNRKLSNKPFADKKEVYRESGYKITNRVVTKYSDWTEKEILETQKEYRDKLIQALDIQKLL